MRASRCARPGVHLRRAARTPKHGHPIDGSNWTSRSRRSIRCSGSTRSICPSPPHEFREQRPTSAGVGRRRGLAGPVNLLRERKRRVTKTILSRAAVAAGVSDRRWRGLAGSTKRLVAIAAIAPRPDRFVRRVARCGAVGRRRGAGAYAARVPRRVLCPLPACAVSRAVPPSRRRSLASANRRAAPGRHRVRPCVALPSRR